MCLPIQKQTEQQRSTAQSSAKGGSGLPMVLVVTAWETPADCNVPPTKSSWSEPRWVLWSLHANVNDGELRGFQKRLVCGITWFPQVMATHWLLAPQHQSQNAVVHLVVLYSLSLGDTLTPEGTPWWMQTVIINSDCMLVIAPCKYSAFQRKKRSLDVYKPVSKLYSQEIETGVYNVRTHVRGSFYSTFKRKIWGENRHISVMWHPSVQPS